MKQSFSGVFCFLGKQKRESRDINATVWILRLLRGWKIDRSLSQRWLLGHSLMENNDALLPWAHLWLLFLHLKTLERKQQEGISVPVMQQCCLVGWESVRCMVAMPAKRDEESPFWSGDVVSLDCITLWVQNNRKGRLVLSQTAPKLKETFKGEDF